jgi:RimJ/RimL family protein N-acetyltransferase
MPLSFAEHADALYEAYSADAEGRLWTYLPYGPFADRPAFDAWLQASAASQGDPLFFTIIDHATQRPGGVCSYLRITPAAGSIEIGHLAYAPRLQRTTAATEAMFLLMRHAFELGYRRYEWKCNALNAPSRYAAERLGFQFEGIFRQAAVVKGRNRDTAWYSIIDQEWPALHRAFIQWLSPANFDADGRQRRSLTALRDETVAG